jgi:hypothetical protein
MLNTMGTKCGRGTAFPSGALSSILILVAFAVFDRFMCSCVDRCVYYLFRPLYCLPFFELRLLISYLTSSNLSYVDWINFLALKIMFFLANYLK